MKNLITIMILFAVGCSNQDAEIKKLTEANAKLQTENTKIQEELETTDWTSDFLKMENLRLMPKDRVATKSKEEMQKEIERLSVLFYESVNEVKAQKMIIGGLQVEIVSPVSDMKASEKQSATNLADAIKIADMEKCF